VVFRRHTWRFVGKPEVARLLPVIHEELLRCQD
jgi:hypothetical protein